ncbi:MAG: cytochrome C [Deltaproteobacteria bacterium]|nr:cytochrome C [Deltaproteobacteria bacterium]
MAGPRARPTPIASEARRRFDAGLGLPLALAGLLSLVACRDPDRALLARLPEAEQARFLRGRAVAVPCWTCHDLAGQVDKVGPSLEGVFGRRSGMAPDQPGSDAMLSAAIVWDEASLAAFLANPAGFVPGSRMVSPGVGDPDALADLIFYLRHVTQPGARTPER